LGFSFALLSATQSDFSFRSLIFHLSAGGIGLVMILLPRCVGVVFNEGVLDTMHRKRRNPHKKSTNTTLIYGAGDLGELFICHVRLSQPETWSNDHFVGFLDDCEALSGRWMRGFRIMGTLEELPQISKKLGVNKILVTSSVLSLERERELKRISKQLGLQLEFWCPDLKVSAEPEGNPPSTRRLETESRPELEIAPGSKENSSI
jgi:UDP-GlcNAc:undecaprenyl-phosphate/decaprenyl-phosphate GlcNAc-1-phosphate transferase